MRRLTEYRLKTPLVAKEYRFCIVSDLHNEPYDDILPMLAQYDALLVPGDIANRYRQECERGIAFIRDAAKILPIFYAPGNHEMRLESPSAVLRQIAECGAHMLLDDTAVFGECLIGGIYLHAKHPWRENFFANADGKFRILLCHKPEWAITLPDDATDLIISGHAHGGQIRVANQGIYAPGQGLFPIYTRGWYMGQKLLVSAGAGNPVHMPRWGNAREILDLRILPES